MIAATAGVLSNGGVADGVIGVGDGVTVVGDGLQVAVDVTLDVGVGVADLVYVGPEEEGVAAIADGSEVAVCDVWVTSVGLGTRSAIHRMISTAKKPNSRTEIATRISWRVGNLVASRRIAGGGNIVWSGVPGSEGGSSAT